MPMRLGESLALAVMKTLGLCQMMQVGEELASCPVAGARTLRWLELVEVHLAELR
jgi:hypothetical protein